jgi:hypothetical protein
VVRPGVVWGCAGSVPVVPVKEIKSVPMTCRVCGHKKRLEIDRALLEGKSLRDIARRATGLSASSLQRHKAEHLARHLVKAHEAREAARADSLLADVRNAEGRAQRLYGVAEDILKKALEAQDLKTALNAIRAGVDVMAEARQYMELRGELTGELSNVADAAANVPLIRVLSVPRMPGVPSGFEPWAIEPGAPPAAETTEGVRSLAAAEVDAPVDSDMPDIPGRNRR